MTEADLINLKSGVLMAFIFLVKLIVRLYFMCMDIELDKPIA